MYKAKWVSVPHLFSACFCINWPSYNDRSVAEQCAAARRNGIKSFQRAGETFLIIVQSADSLQYMAQPIAAATEKMSSVSEHGSNDFQGIAQSFRRNINRSEQICPSLFQHRKSRWEFVSISGQF